MLRASFEYRGDDRMYLVPTSANTQPALAGYVGDRARRAAFPSGLFVLAVAGARIHAITRFHIDELYPRSAGRIPARGGRKGGKPGSLGARLGRAAGDLGLKPR
jgi:hypothetical protein